MTSKARQKKRAREVEASAENKQGKQRMQLATDCLR